MSSEAGSTRPRTRSVSESIRKSLSRMPGIKFSKPKINVPLPKLGLTLLRKPKANPDLDQPPVRSPAPELPNNFPEQFLLVLNGSPDNFLSLDNLNQARQNLKVPENKNQELDEAFKTQDPIEISKAMISAIGVNKFNRVLKPLLAKAALKDQSLEVLAELLQALNVAGCKGVISTSPVAFGANSVSVETMLREGVSVDELNGRVLGLNGVISEPSSLITPALDEPEFAEMLKDAFQTYPLVIVGEKMTSDDSYVDLLKEITPEPAEAKEGEETPNRNVAFVEQLLDVEAADVSLELLKLDFDENRTQIAEVVAKIASIGRKEVDLFAPNEQVYTQLSEELLKKLAENSKGCSLWRTSEALPMPALNALQGEIKVLLGDSAVESINNETAEEIQKWLDELKAVEASEVEFKMSKASGKGVESIWYLKQPKQEEGEERKNSVVIVEKREIVENVTVYRISVESQRVSDAVVRFQENWVAGRPAEEFLAKKFAEFAPKEEAKAEEPAVEEKADQKVEAKAEEKKEEAVEEKKEEPKEEEAEEKKEELTKEEKKKKKEEEKKALKAKKKEEAAKKKEEAAKKKEEAAKKKEEAAAKKKEEAAKKKEEAAKKKEEAAAKKKEAKLAKQKQQEEKKAAAAAKKAEKEEKAEPAKEAEKTEEPVKAEEKPAAAVEAAKEDKKEDKKQDKKAEAKAEKQPEKVETKE